MDITLANAVSISFIGAFIIPVCLFALEHKMVYLYFVAALFAVNGIVVGLKEASRRFTPIFDRPHGATACDIFCLKGSAEGQPGFPSGHVTTATMFVVGMWLQTVEPIVLWLGIPWICLMGWARWAKRCHSVPQILGGAALGTAGGWLFSLSWKY